MPVPACWVARALLRNAFSPAASSPVITVRQVSTGQPGWRKSRWKSPISALPRQPGHTSGKATAESTRTATSSPSPSWKVRPVGATVSARPGAMHCSWSGSRGDQRRTGRRVPPSRWPPMSGAISSELSESSASGSSRLAWAPAEASVPSSARRNAPSAVSAAGPGPPARQAVTNTR